MGLSLREDVIISDIRPDGRYIKSIYDAQLLELAEIKEPGLVRGKQIILAEELKRTVKPVYIEFTWSNQILECVGEEEFFALKTSRNKLLIKTSEQIKLSKLNISIAGMSVGSSALYGLIGTGIGGSFNIADDDTFASTNLNRVSATLMDVGVPKVQVAYRRAKEMNPFLNISAFTSRIDETNIHAFMHEGMVDLIVEEIDDIKMKVSMRDHAKKIKKPLLMLTNVGDVVVIDVERYDMPDQPELFNGLVDSDVIEKIRKEDISKELLYLFITSLLDSSLMTERIKESLSAIGQTLAGRPQLYSTVAVDGGVVPYIARRIFLEHIESGRYMLDLASIG